MLKFINFDLNTYGMKGYEKTVKNSTVKELKRERKLICDLLEDVGALHKDVRLDYSSSYSILKYQIGTIQSARLKCYIDSDTYFWDHDHLVDKKSIRQAKNRFKLVESQLREKKMEDEESSVSDILNKTTLKVKGG